MNELITTNQNTAVSTLLTDTNFWKNVKNTVGKGLENDEFMFFMSVCQQKNLNPVNKEIYAWGSGSGNERKLNIMVGRHGALTIAQRNENYINLRSCEIRENDIFEFCPVENKIIKHIIGGKKAKMIEDLTERIKSLNLDKEMITIAGKDIVDPVEKKELINQFNELRREIAHLENEKAKLEKFEKSLLIGAWAWSERKGMPDKVEVVYFDDYNKGTSAWKTNAVDMIKFKAEKRVLDYHYKSEFQDLQTTELDVEFETVEQNAGENISPAILTAIPEWE